jgi:transposase
MSRSLKIRKPRRTELRKLDGLLCQDLHPRQLRRAHAILLYGEGLAGVDIAAALGAHPLTIYADLRAFASGGLRCLQPPAHGGQSKQLTAAQEARICQLAASSPVDLGRPFSRWTLQKLRAYLLKERIVAHISREHLRRVLQKGGCTLRASNAKSSAVTRSG